MRDVEHSLQRLTLDGNNTESVSRSLHLPHLNYLSMENGRLQLFLDNCIVTTFEDGVLQKCTLWSNLAGLKKLVWFLKEKEKCAAKG
ncbi:LOW QUALITY PROTEIN: uncharacterized protein M6D78_017880 [Vipera latastei]